MNGKEYLKQLIVCLPEKDCRICDKLIQNGKYENVKEIVDSDIKKLEREEDKTGDVEKNLEKLYKLSECLDAYVITFNDVNEEYEEI